MHPKPAIWRPPPQKAGDSIDIEFRFGNRDEAQVFQPFDVSAGSWHSDIRATEYIQPDTPPTISFSIDTSDAADGTVRLHLDPNLSDTLRAPVLYADLEWRIPELDFQWTPVTIVQQLLKQTTRETADA